MIVSALAQALSEDVGMSYTTLGASTLSIGGPEILASMISADIWRGSSPATALCLQSRFVLIGKLMQGVGGAALRAL